MSGPSRRRREIALRRPIFSGPPDLADSVWNLKTRVKGRFPRGGRLPRFDPRLPEIPILKVNTQYDEVAPLGPLVPNLRECLKSYLTSVNAPKHGADGGDAGRSFGHIGALLEVADQAAILY